MGPMGGCGGFRFPGKTKTRSQEEREEEREDARRISRAVGLFWTQAGIWIFCTVGFDRNSYTDLVSECGLIVYLAGYMLILRDRVLADYQSQMRWVGEIRGCVNPL